MSRRESTRVAVHKSLAKPHTSSTRAKSMSSTSNNSADADVDFSIIERKIFEGSSLLPAAVATKIEVAQPKSLIVERVSYDKKLAAQTNKEIREDQRNSVDKQASNKSLIHARNSCNDTKRELTNPPGTSCCKDQVKHVLLCHTNITKSRDSLDRKTASRSKSNYNKGKSVQTPVRLSNHSKSLKVTKPHISKSISGLVQSKSTETNLKTNKNFLKSAKQNSKHKESSSMKCDGESEISDCCSGSTEMKRSKGSQLRRSSRPSTPILEIEKKERKLCNSRENLDLGKSKSYKSQEIRMKSSEYSSKKDSTVSHKLSAKVKSSKDSSPKHAASKRTKKLSSTSKKHSQSSDSEVSDWEDVEGHNTTWNSLLQKDEVAALDILTKKGQPQEASTSNVQIELEAPTLWGAKRRINNKKSDEYWMMMHLRREVNQTIRDDYVNCHKVHLLLLLGHGQHVNKLLNSEELLASALSIVSNKDVYPPKRIDFGYLEKLARWFTKKIHCVDEPLEKGYWYVPLVKMLAKRFEKKEARTAREAVFMFVLIGRSLGMNVRLVCSLKPMHYKPSTEELFRPPLEADGTLTEPMKPAVKKANIKNNDHNKKSEEGNTQNKMVSSSSDESKSCRYLSKAKNKSANIKLTNAAVNKRKKKITESQSNDSDDSDFEITVNQKKMSVKGGSFTSGKSKKDGNTNSSSKRSLSVDSVKESLNKKKKVEIFPEWAEVYVEEEEQWVCVDVIRGKIHCAAELASRAPAPVAHVTAFNPDQSVKDVTKRYVSSWLAYEAKLRCDSSWWGRVLAPYAPPFSARDRAEDQHMDDSLKRQPLPKSVAEYKNHPLYALQRHLLKFEALYPPNPDPVGYCKGEAVFPRKCVHTLHSRDIWLKQAKTVKVDEEAYKVVKARPKWDRALCQMITDRPLDVFGPWQVEDYKPPVAKNGLVPRNEYGNVELFKPTMLPVGTVHIPAEYEDISRVARKLKIDCAPAMVGFDFHKGGTHPVFDGYIVCKEFRDILVDAWREEMEMKAKREEAKRVRRIYDNWKRLIQGMIVKHHVREQYGTGRDSSDEEHHVATHHTHRNKAKKEAAAKPATKYKTKVNQKDIDAARVENSKKEKVQLGIDFHSDTVTMAKNSFKQSLSSKGMVKNDNIDGVESGLHSIVPKKEDLILDSDEEMKETEEEKKRNMQKILAWGNDAKGDLAELSDDSDLEGEKPKAKSGGEQSDPTARDGFAKDKRKRITVSKRTSTNRKQSSGDSSSDFDSKQDQASNTIATAKRKKLTKKKQTASLKSKVADAFPAGVPTRRSRRSAARLTAAYKESEDSDVSINESDLEDKTYKPMDAAETVPNYAAALACADLHLSEDSN